MTVRTLVALAAMGLASTSLAATVPSFKTIDTNHDGKISPAEAKAVKGLSFSAADTNHDGVLEPNEYEMAVKKGAKKA